MNVKPVKHAFQLLSRVLLSTAVMAALLPTSGFSGEFEQNVVNLTETTDRAPQPPQISPSAPPGQVLTYIPHDVQIAGSLAVLGEMVLPQSTLPATPGVAGQIFSSGNELYSFDAVRNKWLAVNRQQLWAGYNGVVTDAYLAPFGGWNTNSTGFYIPRDATLTAFYAVATGNIWRIASVGGDFPTLTAALASPSVVNGDTLLLAAETFTTPALTTINVNKSVLITGADKTLSVLQTAGAGNDPTTLMSITTGNVYLHNFTLKQRKTTNTSIETALSINAPGGNGIVLNNVRIETMEFGVSIANAPNWSIQKSQFVYNGPAGNTHRLLAISNHSGTCSITENTFYPSSDSPTPRTIFCLVTGGTHTGSLEISNNVQSGGDLRQFFVQEDFSGPAGGFALYINNNTYIDNNSGIAFFMGAANQLNLFSSITVASNNCTNGHHKGLINLDGAGGPFASPGTTTWRIANNIIANPGVTAPGWADATGGAGLIGYKTAVFTPPLTIPYSTTIIPAPDPYANFSIEVRLNGAATPIAILPVTGFASYIAAMNVDVGAGNMLQFYLSGTASKPVVGLEYAYRS